VRLDEARARRSHLARALVAFAARRDARPQTRVMPDGEARHLVAQPELAVKPVREMDDEVAANARPTAPARGMQSRGAPRVVQADDQAVAPDRDTMMARLTARRNWGQCRWRVGVRGSPRNRSRRRRRGRNGHAQAGQQGSPWIGAALSESGLDPAPLQDVAA
jgi:hypothetical protein